MNRNLKSMFGISILLLIIIGEVGAAEPVVYLDTATIGHRLDQDIFETAVNSKIVEGTLVQDASEKGGLASAIIAGSEAWSAYEFSCDIRILDAPHRSGVAGIQLQNKDGGDPVQIYIGSHEEICLYKSRGQLEAVKVALEKNTWHRLQINRRGTITQVYIDGKHIVNVPHDDFTGKIQLRTHQAKSAFRNIRASALPNATDVSSPNVINNSSFEYASSSSIPDYWGMALWGLHDKYWITHRDELWQRWGRRTENPFHGNYCMRVDGMQRVWTTMLYPQPGEKHVVSLYLRADQDRFPVRLNYMNWRGSEHSLDVIVSQEWARYEMKIPALDTGRGLIGIASQSEGVLWVDAVQLESGEIATPYQVSSEDTLRSEDSGVADVPAVEVAYVDNAEFVLDGKLNESMWKNVVPLKMVTKSGKDTSDDTVVRMVSDDENIYISVTCYDRNMSEAKGKIDHRDGFVWTDDSLELFINPSNRQHDYHLGVSITGAQYDSVMDDSSWNGDWQVATTRFEDRWVAEVVLPFEMFDLSEFDLGEWKFNICRTNQATQEYSCWSPTYSTSFHNAGYWGVLLPFPVEVTSKWKSHAEVGEDETRRSYHLPTLEVDGEPYLAYGIDWNVNELPGHEVYGAMKQANMNLLEFVGRQKKFQLHSIEDIRQSLELASEYGIKVVYRVHRQGSVSNENLTVIEHAISNFKNVDSIIAWIVLDEPHENPKIVRRAVEFAKELDPTRPAFINVTPTGLGSQIGGLPGDIICVDRYPVEFDGSTMKDIGDVARTAAELAGARDIPLWFFLQSFSNVHTVWRSVTADELTAQTYEALINGARGIIYYRELALTQETWQRQIEIGAQIQTLTPILVSDEVKAIRSDNEKIDFVCKEYNGETYLLAVNPYPTSEKVLFDLSSVGLNSGDKVQYLFDTEAEVSHDNQVVRDDFKPYQMRCYKITHE